MSRWAKDNIGAAIASILCERVAEVGAPDNWRIDAVGEGMYLPATGSCAGCNSPVMLDNTG